MLKELAGIFGWLVIILFVGTILNYVLKPINKKYGKTLKPDSFGKKCLQILMKIFVMNHKYFGIAAGIFLIIHFVLEFIRYGMSLSGLLAAVVMMVEIVLGVHAKMNKKPRRGTWFIVHRIVTIVILITIFMHLVFPWVVSRVNDVTNGTPVTSSRDTTPSATDATQSTDSSTTTDPAQSTDSSTTTDSGTTNPPANIVGPTADTATDSNAANATNASNATQDPTSNTLPTFTMEQLAQNNGQDGNKAYVAYNGNVYDVTDHPQWRNGTHHGEKAGTDITNAIGHSPHGPSVLNEIPVVGTLQ